MFFCRLCCFISCYVHRRQPCVVGAVFSCICEFHICLSVCPSVRPCCANTKVSVDTVHDSPSDFIDPQVKGESWRQASVSASECSCSSILVYTVLLEMLLCTVWYSAVRDATVQCLICLNLLGLLLIILVCWLAVFSQLLFFFISCFIRLLRKNCFNRDTVLVNTVQLVSSVLWCLLSYS